MPRGACVDMYTDIDPWDSGQGFDRHEH
jgi:hypothetical protein